MVQKKRCGISLEESDDFADSNDDSFDDKAEIKEAAEYIISVF